MMPRPASPTPQLYRPALAALLLALTAACSPTVQVAMPTEPIHIKLDVKIEHEIRVKVEQQLDKLLGPESGLF